MANPSVGQNVRWTVCPTCGGTGYFTATIPANFVAHQVTCARCNGTGKVAG